MRIGIDARLISQTGVGRYIRNLLRELAVVDSRHEYIVFLRKRDWDAFTIPNPRWQKREADVPWHSFAEQWVMPWLYVRERIHLVHVPYFNVPIFYPGKFIVTIHDITIAHVDTGQASTLPYWLYKIRRLGYKIILAVGVYRASRIITVSRAVKKDILGSLHQKDTKVIVTYEGVEPEFLRQRSSGELKNPFNGGYFLYVGNVYPHKNIEVLLRAYLHYKDSVKQPNKLIFVGPSDYFYDQLKVRLASFGMTTHVEILHHLSDRELYRMYAHATALILPSRFEGFGLPGLEALACGCRVICSDIPVFHEILGPHATYVDTKSPLILADAMKLISQAGYNRASFRISCLQFLSKYSWETMAKETLHVYEKVDST